MLAASCHRPLAARVAKAGALVHRGGPLGCPVGGRGPCAYRDKLVGPMGAHATSMGTRLDDFFAEA